MSSSKRLWNQKEIAAALGVSNTQLGAFLSSNRHRHVPITVAGSAFYYYHVQANRIINDFLEFQFMTPLPTGPTKTRIVFQLQAQKAAQNVATVVKAKLHKFVEREKLALIVK